MPLTLILGPMKSGKSFDLISYFSPLAYTSTNFALYQPARNVRDSVIESRSGLSLDAKKIRSLKDIGDHRYDVIGIDELHMFDVADIIVLRRCLNAGTRVIASGLDTDYRGVLFDTIRATLELGPSEVLYKRAVCKGCRGFSATHTQVYEAGKPLMAGMPSVIPDDGRFTYEPVCRRCFVWDQTST